MVDIQFKKNLNRNISKMKEKVNSMKLTAYIHPVSSPAAFDNNFIEALGISRNQNQF